MTFEEAVGSTAAVLTIAQTAGVLADGEGKPLDPRTVRRACRDGQLPSVIVGRRVLVPRLPLLALLDGGGRDSVAAGADGG